VKKAGGASKESWDTHDGGVLIVLSTLVPTLLWADLTNGFVLLAVFALLAFATIGFVDDYAKVAKQRNLGLTVGKNSPANIGQLHHRYRTACASDA